MKELIELLPDDNHDSGQYSVGWNNYAGKARAALSGHEVVGWAVFNPDRGFYAHVGIMASVEDAIFDFLMAEDTPDNWKYAQSQGYQVLPLYAKVGGRR